jgi:hypothetical protein
MMGDLGRVKDKLQLAKSIEHSLEFYEDIIRQGMNSFIEVGNALRAIRDEKKYKTEFRTFEEYCRKRWGFSKTYANYQISAAGAASNLTTKVVKPDFSERLIRPIVDLEFDKQKEVWEKAVETAPDGKLTAKHVAEIAKEYREPPKPKPPPLFDADLWAMSAYNAVSSIADKWPKGESLQPLIESLQDCLDNLKRRKND